MVGAEPVRGIALVPSFEALPALFMPDLEHALLAARLAAWLDERASRGERIPHDLGASGRTADETARALAEQGCTQVHVLGAPYDRTAVALLVDALTRAGIEPLGQPDSLAASPSRRHETEAAGPEPGADGEPRPLLVNEPGAPRPARGALFEQRGLLALERVRSGPAGTWPAWVKRIRPLGDASGALDPEALHVIDWEARASIADAARAVEGAVCELGPAHVRLALPRGPRGGPVQLGLDELATRARWTELVARALPQHGALLGNVLGFHELGVDPWSEMYAGNSLPDRNAELVVNIVR